MDDKRRITAKEAIALLIDGDRIHTMRSNGFAIIGADWDRSNLIKCIKKNEKTLEIAGSMARAMKHGIALIDDVSPLFIETNEEKLNTFDPIEKTDK